MFEGEDFSGMEQVLAIKTQPPPAMPVNKRPPVDFSQISAVLAQNKPNGTVVPPQAKRRK